MKDKPLNILTLDGGGLQGIAALTIVDDLMIALAKHNDISGERPKPCEVFDVIAGIGSGGWLAILLGRFRMDVLSAVTEWLELIQVITPKSRVGELKSRLLQHSYFDQDRLVGRVNAMCRIYETGEHFQEAHPSGARACRVFVAAQRADARGYSLFRSYPVQSPQVPDEIREGPQDPQKFKMSSAFGVTGAAKYFSPPWVEEIADGVVRFQDTKFPELHNITELALDELCGLYGPGAPISVIVNIGPGLPTNADVKHITHRFSGSLKAPIVHPPTPANPAGVETQGSNVPTSTSDPLAIRFDTSTPKSGLIAVFTKDESVWKGSAPSFQFAAPFGPPADGDVNTNADDSELKMKYDLFKRTTYGNPFINPQIYFRFAPDIAPQGTFQNDSVATNVVYDAAKDYLRDARTQTTIGKVVERLSVTRTGI